MDFRELNYVLAIAKYQNITKAAESLYIGQPTLASTMNRMMKTMIMGTNSSMSGRIALTPPFSPSAAKAKVGNARIIETLHGVCMHGFRMIVTGKNL